MPIQAAILLAGGAGTRIWPYAEIRNKCAIPVANVPNIRRLADALYEIGVRRIVVVVGPHAGSIKHALLGAAAQVTFVTQPADGGTAGAVLEALSALDDARFLVVYADVVTPAANLRAVAETPEQAGAEGAVLWDEMPAGEGSLWYSADIQDGCLQSVTGHEAGAGRRLCGVFALDRSLVPYLEANPGLLR